MTLDIRGRRCALRADVVREILPVPRLHRPPEAAPALAGFMDLGGSVLPVLRLASLLGLDEGAEAEPFYGHVVRLRRDVAARRVGFLADRALGLRQVAADDLRPVQPGETLNGLVEAAISDDGALTHLLAADRLLLAEERAALDAWTLRAAARIQAWSAAP
nr:chemotaxis protein CheW [Alsobacter soli]